MIEKLSNELPPFEKALYGHSLNWTLWVDAKLEYSYS